LKEMKTMGYYWHGSNHVKLIGRSMGIREYWRRRGRETR
jgi:hypothetical protein